MSFNKTSHINFTEDQKKRAAEIRKKLFSDYKKIQNKESDLPRSKRDQVVKAVRELQKIVLTGDEDAK